MFDEADHRFHWKNAALTAQLVLVQADAIWDRIKRTRYQQADGYAT